MVDQEQQTKKGLIASLAILGLVALGWFAFNVQYTEPQSTSSMSAAKTAAKAPLTDTASITTSTVVLAKIADNANNPPPPQVSTNGLISVTVGTKTCSPKGECAPLSRIDAEVIVEQDGQEVTRVTTRRDGPPLTLDIPIGRY